MAEHFVRVECHSGYKADERPVRILFAGRTLAIAEVEDRWYSPGATYFGVLAEDGDRYVLRHDDAQDVWSLTAYRQLSKVTAGQRVDTKINQSV
jgi:hypothetical protein